MSDTIRIEFFAEKKRRNKHEVYTVAGARAGNTRHVSNGPIIPALCRKLIAGGHSPDALAMIYRGDTLCFTPVSIGTWASGKALSTQEQPAYLRRAVG